MNTERSTKRVFPLSEGLAGQRLRHAALLYLGSALGAAAAVAWGVRFGVTGLDWALLAGFYSLTYLGITVGYHRHFSHRSFKAKPFVRWALAAMGSTAGQGSVLYWASNHRHHHQFSDKPEDIHSPYVRGGETFGVLDGLWHGQVSFAWHHGIVNAVHYTPDLVKDRGLRLMNRLYLPFFAAGLALPALIGLLATGTAAGAASGFLFGGALRLFATLHFTNAINSATHYFGRRRFHTTDESRNLALLAIPTFGESWHNNHHAFPKSAFIGLHWWELDLGGLFIRALRAAGLASEVKTLAPAEIAAKLIRAPEAVHA